MKYWNSRSRVASAAVWNLPMSVKQTHESEPASSSQSQHDHTVNQMIRNHSLDNIALIFWLTASVIGECVRLSRQWDSEFNVFCSQVCVAYKCKTDKVQPVD